MKWDNKTVILVVLVGFLVVLGIYFVLNSKKYKKSKDKKKNEPSMELVQPADEIDDDSAEYVLQPDDNGDDSFETGFGMGPGLYGSGRHTSEMVGN